MNSKFAYVGSGWSFPPTFNKEQQGVEMVVDEEDINHSLEILFTTTPGERFLHPLYGCDLKRFLFEPVNTTLLTSIREMLKTAILYYEPRINVLKIELNPLAEEGILEISIEYKIRTTNSRYNFVYPFNLEGSGIQP